MIFELVQDFHNAIAAMPREHPKHRMLELIEEAIRRDIHFIARHPTTLFQCMWNTCWWYDCPEAATYYLVPKDGWPSGDVAPPWLRPGLRIHTFVESWHEMKEDHTPRFAWIRSLRPSPVALDSPYRGVLSSALSMLCCVALSADGRRMAGISYGRDEKPSAVHLWDAQTGRTLGEPLESGSSGNCCCFAISPDGIRIATGGMRVRLWEVDSRQCSGTLSGDYEPVCGIAFSACGRWIATGSSDGTVRLWDAVDLHLVHTLGKHGRAITVVVFSPDGNLLATAGACALALWECCSGTRALLIREWDEIRALAFSAAGSCLALGRDDGAVRMYGLSSDEPLRAWDAHRHPIAGISFTEQDRLVVTAASDDPLRVWDCSNGTLLRAMRCGDDHPTSLTVSPDGRTIVAGCREGPLWVWSSTGDSEQRVLGGTAAVGQVVVSPDGSRVVSGMYTSTLHLWDANTGILLQRYGIQEYEAGLLGFSADGQYLAIKSRNIDVYSAATGKQVAEIDVRANGVDKVAFSADGKLVAVAFRENSCYDLPSVVSTWQVSRFDARKLVDFTVHQHMVRGVVFLRDSRRLLTLSADGQMCVWDAHTGTVLQRWTRGRDTLCVLQSPAEDVVACIDFFGSSVQLWDLDTGRELPPLSGLLLPVTDARFEGPQLVTRSQADQLQVWNVREGRCVRCLEAADMVDRMPFAFERDDEALRETAFICRQHDQRFAWFPASLDACSDPGQRRWFGWEGTPGGVCTHLYALSVEGPHPADGKDEDLTPNQGHANRVA